MARMGLEPIPLLFVCSTGIEPVPLVLQTSVRTSYTKSTYCGQQWTRTTPFRTDFTDRLSYPNDFCYPIFVPCSGIEPLPFPCKRNTLPLRQQGNLCTPGWPRTIYPSVKSGVPVHMSFEGKKQFYAATLYAL